MDIWRQFEHRVYNETMSLGMFITRIPTGARIIKFKGRRIIRTIKTDCDFVAGCYGKAIFLDAKATEQNYFNLKSSVLNEKVRHQYLALMNAHLSGNQAGYLVWFYSLRKICWIPIKVIHEAIGVSKSVGPSHAGVSTQDDFRVIDLGRLTCISK